MFIEVAKTGNLAPGGMKAVEVGGKEVVICNFDGKICALERKCGHMGAPLEMGTLDGSILTCPLHHAQFDITTGEALSGPLYPDSTGAIMNNFSRWFAKLAPHVKTYDLKTYETQVEGNSIKVKS
ncbi:MAG TPA: Rieske 2Fe-2S domain-containing protein [Candidatus Bathyarchaeia archaeon]|nr:Rieske 2Fe-2S domain-containing protein [Candidatus Bathyarchaeia archaeon]